MERANDATLHQRPETFDGIGVGVAMHIFPLAMMHHTMQEILVQIPIAAMIVNRNQAYLMRYSFIYEVVKGVAVGAVDHAGNHVVFALNRANYDALAMSTSPAEVTTATFAFVFVHGLSADVGFVYLDVADHLAEFDVTERNANLAAHEMRGIVGTEAHHAVDLQGADAFLAGQHHVHDAEPIAQRLVGVLKDRADQYGEAIAYAIRRALVAIPVIRPAMFMHLVKAATRAEYYAIRPAVSGKVFLAGIFIREKLFELRYRHLVNLQVFLGFGFHGLTPINMESLNHA